MREKLIELLKESAQCPHVDDDEIICCDECEWFVEGESCCPPRMADYLIANGVTVRQKGEWIAQDNTYTRFMCSACGSKNHEGGQNYCSHCGAEMERGA